MKLLEYEAKGLLKKYAAPLPESFIVTSSSEAPAFLPCVLKSQVPTGGRGKAGGVKVVKTADEFTRTAADILALNIKGFTPQKLLAEQLIDIDREFYLSLLLDYATSQVIVMAHPHGGVEVEDNAAGDFITLPLDDRRAATLAISEAFDVPDQQFALEELLDKLAKAFTAEDVLLLEINPLILTKSGEFILGDCKMEVDSAARFRHDDWQFEEQPADVNFVTLNQNGNTATIANGAGLAMATVDSVYNAGLTPANFLDVGGGANEASVLAAFQRIQEFKKVEAIVINIFAGITRCDEIAKAILAAKAQIQGLPTLYIHLEGTNFDEAKVLLEPEQIKLYATLDECLVAAKGAAK